MGSGIWEVTLPLAVDSIGYKFTVDWTDQENFAGGEPCTKTIGKPFLTHSWRYGTVNSCTDTSSTSTIGWQC